MSGAGERPAAREMGLPWASGSRLNAGPGDPASLPEAFPLSGMFYLDPFFCQTPTHCSRPSNGTFSAKSAPKSHPHSPLEPLRRPLSMAFILCLSFIMKKKNGLYLLYFPFKLPRAEFFFSCLLSLIPVPNPVTAMLDEFC